VQLISHSQTTCGDILLVQHASVFAVADVGEFHETDTHSMKRCSDSLHWQHSQWVTLSFKVISLLLQLWKPNAAVRNNRNKAHHFRSSEANHPMVLFLSFCPSMVWATVEISLTSQSESIAKCHCFCPK